MTREELAALLEAELAAALALAVGDRVACEELCVRIAMPGRRAAPLVVRRRPERQPR